MWEKISLVLWVHVAVTDVESNGMHNHLLETDRVDRQYSISYSSPEKLEYSYNEWFQIRVEGECQEIYKLDEAPKSMSGAYPYGIPRKAYICNADKLEMLK